MTTDMRDLLTRIGKAMYGEQWQSALSDDIGVNRRTVRRWLAEDGPISMGLAEDLLLLVRQRRIELSEIEDALEAELRS
jgi:hypothetical protein